MVVAKVKGTNIDLRHICIYLSPLAGMPDSATSWKIILWAIMVAIDHYSKCGILIPWSLVNPLAVEFIYLVTSSEYTGQMNLPAAVTLLNKKLTYYCHRPHCY